MKVYDHDLSDVSRYLERSGDADLAKYELQFRRIINKIEKFKAINKDTSILEIGIGTGWLPILCKISGIACTGLEISPQLIKFARNFAKKYDIEPEIILGNIEDHEIGRAKYDVIIASSTFEHIEHWREALTRVFDALKPGGAFLFVSTNKFSPVSGEYNFPLYGWLPNTWRYRLRIARQGEDIMKLGIDFNQFTYFQLRRVFKQIGFPQVFDLLDIIDLQDFTDASPLKRLLIAAAIKWRFLKHISLIFAPTTQFVCIK